MTKEIRFYRSTGKYGFLSNLYPVPVVFADVVYKSSEHAYQAQKPNKREIREWIMAAPYPRLAAAAGHGLAFYDTVSHWNQIPKRKGELPDPGLRHKVVIMRAVLLAKFSQHPSLRDKLLATGNALLVEDSTIDPFWGIGHNGKGQNWLGICLMDVRSSIREHLRRKGSS